MHVLSRNTLDKFPCFLASCNLAICQQSFAHRKTLRLPIVTADCKLAEQLFLCSLQLSVGKKVVLQLCNLLVYGYEAFIEVVLVAAGAARNHSGVGKLGV